MVDGYRTYQKSFIARFTFDNVGQFQWIKIKKLKRKNQTEHLLRMENLHVFKGNVKFLVQPIKKVMKINEMNQQIWTNLNKNY